MERRSAASQVNTPPVFVPNPVVMADTSGKITKPSATVRKFGRRRQNPTDVGGISPWQIAEPVSIERNTIKEREALKLGRTDTSRTEHLDSLPIQEDGDLKSFKLLPLKSEPPLPQPVRQVGENLVKDTRIREGQEAIRGRLSHQAGASSRPKEASLPPLPDRRPSIQACPAEAWDGEQDWQSLGMPGGGERILLPNQVPLNQVPQIMTEQGQYFLVQQSEASAGEQRGKVANPLFGQQEELLEVTLPEQVDYINQLSADLEVALFRLRAMSLQADGQAGRSQPDLAEEANQKPGLRNCEAALLPYVHQQAGGYVLANRQVDLLKAEREAASTAQLLRRLVDRQVETQPSNPTHVVISRPSPESPTGKAVTGKAVRTKLDAKKHPAPNPKSNPKPNRQSSPTLSSKSSSKSVQGGALVRFDPARRSSQTWLQRWLQPPASWPNALADSFTWIVVAGILRIGLQFFLVSHVNLWMPVMLLVTVLVIVVAYQSVFVSKSGWLLTYRLLLVMLGLLLGGRFWNL